MGSLLALRQILLTHYKVKDVRIFAESMSAMLSFLPGISSVNTHGLFKTLMHERPDALIFLDFNMWHMVSPRFSEQIKQSAFEYQIPTIVIDHHPVEIKNIESTLFINREDSSTAQTLFRVFHDELDLPLTADIANCLLAGILSDTERFKYHHPSLEYTFSTMPKLLTSATFTIQDLTEIMTTYPAYGVKSLEVFLSNMVCDEDGLTYAVIHDHDVIRHELKKPAISVAAKFVMSHIMLAIDSSKWGFVMYPYLNEVGKYTVSFRSKTDEFSARLAAEQLGGGGHDKASAVRISADDSEKALQKVLEALKPLRNPQS